MRLQNFTSQWRDRGNYSVLTDITYSRIHLHRIISWVVSAIYMYGLQYVSYMMYCMSLCLVLLCYFKHQK